MHHAPSRQRQPKLQSPASGLDEPAKGGEIEISLPIDREDRRLLDPKGLGPLGLAALSEQPQDLQPSTSSCSSAARASIFARRSAGRAAMIPFCHRETLNGMCTGPMF